MAYKLAEYTKSDTIFIVGRNKEAGEQIVSDLKTISTTKNPIFQGKDPNVLKHAFISCDVTLMSNVKKLAQEIRDKISSESSSSSSSSNPAKLNYLVFSAGFLSMKGRDETEEGIDRKLACNFYSRYLLIRELAPLLENAAQNGEDARVISVFGAGYEGPIFKDDLDLKNNFTLTNAGNVTHTYNSLMMESFSKVHANISFSHIAPGYVSTNVGRELPWYLRFSAALFSPLATSPEDCAEWMTFALTNEKFKNGWHLFNRHADKLQPSQYQTQENIDLVWKHGEEMTKPTY